MTTLILNKDGLQITKSATNKYQFCFYLENNNIYMNKIVDFHLIKLVSDLNPDVYEYTNIEHINDTQANITSIFTPLKI